MSVQSYWNIVIFLFSHCVSGISGGTELIKPVLRAKEFQIIKGHELSLHCQINPNITEVTWFRNGDIVASAMRHSTGSCDWEAVKLEEFVWIECDRKAVNLTIQDVTEIGVWTCADSNTNRPSDPVQVAFRHEKRGLHPKLTAKRKTLIPGNDLELECKVDMNVKRIIWYRNGVSVGDIHRVSDNNCRVVWHKESRFHTQCEGISTRLTISDVISSDGSDWYCYDSTHHIKSNRVHIKVLTPTDRPVLVTSQEIANLGSHIELTCVLPYKSPLVKWTVNDLAFGDATMQFMGGCTFVVEEVVPDRFDYECDKRTLSIGFTALPNQNRTRWSCRDPYRKLASPEAEVIVTLPSVWPSWVNLRGNYGSTVDHNGMTLTCTSFCDHHFVFKWHFGNMSGVIERSTFDSTQHRCSQTLTLQPDWTYNGRTVRCQVANTDTGKTRQAKVILDVEYPPIPRVSLDLTSTEGTSPVLVCRVDANPPNVTFYPWKHMHNGMLVREIQGNQTKMEYRLELPEPSYRDEGVYVCIVSNSVLQQTGREPIPKDITFQPEGAPEFVESDIISLEHTNTSVILSQRIISHSNLDEVTWIFNDDQLVLPSSGYVNVVNRSSVDVIMYSKNITREVYDIILVIKDVNELTSGSYTLELCNILGCAVTESIFIHEAPPGDMDVVDEVEEVAEVSSLGLGQILAFSIGLVILISTILIIIVIIKRRRGQSRED